MASIIYQVVKIILNISIFILFRFNKVEDLNVLDEIAQSVSGYALEKEFNMAFVNKKPDTKKMMRNWGQDLKEVDKFVRLLLDLHKDIETKEVTSKQTVSASEDLKLLISQLKQLFS